MLAKLDSKEQAARGQYFTPSKAAQIIAGLPRIPATTVVHILDPGAGSGILSAALADRIHSARPDLDIHITVVENDAILHDTLRETLADIEHTTGATTNLVKDNFIEWALATPERFDLVIQNPPYAKLRSDSYTQSLLRDSGIIVPNIYAAFLALGVRLLKNGGQQVAITPRSWMNGTYYSAFRRNLVRSSGIDAVHTFESRSKVFGDTGVLQESIIVSTTKGHVPSSVTVFTSYDHSTAPSKRTVDYIDVVTPNFIHVPATEQDASAVAWMSQHATQSLADLGLTVSTGRVVDFRSRDNLHHTPVPGAVPMLNASHLRGGIARHPIQPKKPEWFKTESDTEKKLLVPGGTYVLIKRFSAKEERRRIVAATWDSDKPVAFDNKLNFIHEDGHGMDPIEARGLWIFLNSSQIDHYFRVFSGHTQVNATDLRQMQFPTHQQLKTLGKATIDDQDSIDSTVEAVLTSVRTLA